MRNRLRNSFIFASALLICGVLFSCSNLNDDNSKDAEEIVSYETGSTTVKMFVPDYYAMAEDNSSRAIAPQTAYVQLSAWNSKTSAWNLQQQLNLSDAEVTAVENAPSGFPGNVFTLTFDKVYAKTYAAGELKISLLNSSAQEVTSGTNSATVTVQSGKSASSTFYTIPTDYAQSSSSLAKGEMKFVRYILQSNTHYTFHVDVDGSTYPDVVVFAENGTFEKYISVDSADASRIDFPASSEKSIKYIGVWNDDSTAISKYTVNMYTDLTDFSFKDSSIGFWGGESYKINLTPVPDDAYLETATYSSSNENITVSEDGIISGNAEAEGTITVTVGNISHSIAVNVYENATELSGVLSGDNLHWTKANSPYKVTGDVLIEEETELIIDPGVKVYFTGNNYIKMNGSIYAVGTKDEPITITKAASYSGYWDGMRIGGGSLTTSNTYQYSSGNILKYVNFSYADTPVTLSNATYVDHCKFVDCCNHAYDSSDSVLINNDFESGLYDNEQKAVIVNNLIYKTLKLNWFDGVFTNNTISNAEIYFSTDTNLSVSSNEIINSTISIGGMNSGNVRNNNFIDMTGVILDINTSHDSYKKLDFTANYWGESQTNELIANEATGNKNVSFITDYRDNFNYTEVDYSDWVRTPIEGAGYQGDGFIAFDYTVNGYNWNNGGYYPESKDTALTIAVTPQYNANDISYVRVAQGYENLTNAEWQAYTGSVSFTADTAELSDGFAPIYVQLKDSEGNVSSAICHKVPFDSPVVACNIADGTSYKNASSQTLTIKATDNGKISEYDISVDGVSVSHKNESWYGTSYSWKYTLGLAYMYSGSHIIQMTVWDVAGNYTTKEISITVINANSDVSSLAGVSWDTTTGQPLKDDRTVALWHLDSDGTETGGDSINTLSSYTQNSSVSGLGGCASYASTSNSISIDVSTNNAYTVEFWKNGIGKFETEISKIFDCYINLSASSLQMKNFWYYKNTSGTVDCDYIETLYLNADDWHYWTCVYDGTYAAIYRDGILLTYSDGINKTLNTNENKLYLNCYDVDEIRISNAARSADEIKTYYDCAKELIK